MIKILGVWLIIIGVGLQSTSVHPIITSIISVTGIGLLIAGFAGVGKKEKKEG